MLIEIVLARDDEAAAVAVSGAPTRRTHRGNKVACPHFPDFLRSLIARRTEREKVLLVLLVTVAVAVAALTEPRVAQHFWPVHVPPPHREDLPGKYLLFTPKYFGQEWDSKQGILLRSDGTYLWCNDQKFERGTWKAEVWPDSIDLTFDTQKRSGWVGWGNGTAYADGKRGMVLVFDPDEAGGFYKVPDSKAVCSGLE